MKALELKKKNFTYILRLVKKFYGTPENRWQYHYSNGDNYYHQNWTYIEKKRIEQPFNPKDSPKTYPDYFSTHSYVDDFRYNKKVENLPTRHVTPVLYLKNYDKSDINALMHGNEWNEMQPDYQIEEPISSNHYYQQGGNSRALYAFIYLLIFGVCKYLYFFNYFYLFILIRL